MGSCNGDENPGFCIVLHLVRARWTDTRQAPFLYTIKFSEDHDVQRDTPASEVDAFIKPDYRQTSPIATIDEYGESKS